MKPAFLLMALLALDGCAPAYDDVGDKLQVDTQKQIDAGLDRLSGDRQVTDGAARAKSTPGQIEAATTDASYAANIAFYASSLASLTALKSRMQALGDASSAKEAEAVAQIETNLTQVRDEHAKEGMLGAEYVALMKGTIDQQFIPLNQYELQLKAGKKPG